MRARVVLLKYYFEAGRSYKLQGTGYRGQCQGGDPEEKLLNAE